MPRPRPHPARALVPTLLLLASALAAPTAVTGQDRAAVKTAQDLLAKRTPVARVARTLASDHRLDPAGVARTLAAVSLDVTRTATGLRDGLKVDDPTLVAALVAAEFRETEIMQTAVRMGVKPATVARAFRRARVPAETTAAAMRSTGAPAAATAAALREARYSGDEAAPALARSHRLGPDDVARSLRDGGYRARDGVRGLVQVAGGSRDAVRSMDRVGYDPSEIRQVAIHVLQFTPVEWVEYLKENGADVLEAAAALRNDYGLDAAAGAEILVRPPVQYSIQNMASALRLVWELDVHAAYAVLSEILSYSGLALVLEGGGYEVLRPTIHRYRIRDPRPTHGGQWLENVGIVDPSRVGPANPEPQDGQVEVLVPFRELDQIEATMDGVGGTIVSRTPHTYQADGISHDGEWLTLEFRGFDSGDLRLSRLGRTSSVPALSLGYRMVDGDLFTGSLEELSVTLGDPVGEGLLVVPDRTWEGFSLPGATETFDVPAHRGLGVDADVVDLSSSDVSVQVSPAGEGTVSMEITIDFESSGAEVEGTFLDYVPCWTCSTFQVPLSECFGIDIPCFLSVLGVSLDALGTCLDPSNWEEQELAAGPATPFEADLSGTSLRLGYTVGPDGAGGFFVQSQPPVFEAGISLRSGSGPVELHVLEGWILGEVNARLFSALDALDLGGQIEDGLESAQSMLGWGDVRSVYVVPSTGRWFIETQR